MINYFLQILIDFIRHRVFRQGQTDEPRESDEPTESLDCSCTPPLSNDHPPDFKRLLEVFKLVHEALDPLFPVIDPIHAFDTGPLVTLLGMRMTHIIESAIENFAATKFYAEKAIEDLEKLVRNEPVDPGFIEITRIDNAYGLTRRLEYLRMRPHLLRDDP